MMLRTSSGWWPRDQRGHVAVNATPIPLSKKSVDFRARGIVRRTDWHRLIAAYGGCCVLCGCRTELTRDHVIPRSKGGANHLSNLQPACYPCNQRKADTVLDARPSNWREIVRSIIGEFDK